MEARLFTYLFGGGETQDATVSANSDEQETVYNYNFHVAVAAVGLVGNGSYTLQVSDTPEIEESWYDYAAEFTSVSTVDAIEDSDALTWKYSRIKYDAGGASAGTVQFNLTLKSH